MNTDMIQILHQTPRSVTFELGLPGHYYLPEEYDLYLNGKFHSSSSKRVRFIANLKPLTSYQVTVTFADGRSFALGFETLAEKYTFNVKDFGARGDGEQDDTSAIQAAIMACPVESRVLVPAGTYSVGALFLKSNLLLELSEGAVLRFHKKDQALPPILPGFFESYDETDEHYLGTWEGNPLPMYASLLTGIGLENVTIYGGGCLDGQASFADWWKEENRKTMPFRPRLLFLSQSKKITITGITLKNSPSWTLHPHFCNELFIGDIQVVNPMESPNTDGLDIESCKDVLISGCRFSLGDDCIALKSGKIYLGRRLKVASERIEIRSCFMEKGHGAVTIGSEVAAGVKNLRVRECLFQQTDRGVRMKTRRGRGKDSVLDDLTFENITMSGVKTPIAINCFYFCDPDGKTHYVQNREALPVDYRTPEIGELNFSRLQCTDIEVAAAFIIGLPEQKIRKITIKNSSFSYAEKELLPEEPEMLCGVAAVAKGGMIISNVEQLFLENVELEGQGEIDITSFSGVETVNLVK